MRAGSRLPVPVLKDVRVEKVEAPGHGAAERRVARVVVDPLQRVDVHRGVAGAVVFGHAVARGEGDPLGDAARGVRLEARIAQRAAQHHHRGGLEQPDVRVVRPAAVRAHAVDAVAERLAQPLGVRLREALAELQGDVREPRAHEAHGVPVPDPLLVVEPDEVAEGGGALAQVLMVEHGGQDGVGPLDLLAGAQQRGGVLEAVLAHVQAALVPAIRAPHQVCLRVEVRVAIGDGPVAQKAIRRLEVSRHRYATPQKKQGQRSTPGHLHPLASMA